MAIWDILQKAEQDLRKCTDYAFSEEAIQKQMEVRRQILEQIESRIMLDATGTVFPYEKVSICFCPPSKEFENAFRVTFLRDHSLKNDILFSLQESHAQLLENLEIFIDPGKCDTPRHQDDIVYYEMEFAKPNPSTNVGIPKVKLKVSKGVAERPEYCMCKERILIGRSLEVMDREGRVIRQNDIVFSDTGEEGNSTVSYAHARIWWDFVNQEFLIMDEVSRYGTCVVRNGRSLEAPAGNSCGIRLQPGDQIYCGQACLLFALASDRAT